MVGTYGYEAFTSSRNWRCESEVLRSIILLESIVMCSTNHEPSTRGNGQGRHCGKLQPYVYCEI
jgi:hypothetical protein